MQAAEIDNGTVVNIIEVASLSFKPGLVAANGASIGDKWDGVKFTKPMPAPTPAPVPLEVTRRQGLQALFMRAGITEAMVEEKIRLVVTDPAKQYLALTDFRASQTFERNNALVLLLGGAFGLDLNDLFTFAKTL